jgi:uncharacterized membrane protein
VIKTIVDILLAIGTALFVVANFRQLRKIQRTHRTDGISGTHSKLKVVASVCVLSACILGVLPIAFVTNAIDITITITIITLLAKYRKIKIWKV